jgi:hypothetical protein
MKLSDSPVLEVVETKAIVYRPAEVMVNVDVWYGASWY